MKLNMWLGDEFIGEIETMKAAEMEIETTKGDDCMQSVNNYVEVTQGRWWYEGLEGTVHEVLEFKYPYEDESLDYTTKAYRVDTGEPMGRYILAEDCVEVEVIKGEEARKQIREGDKIFVTKYDGETLPFPHERKVLQVKPGIEVAYLDKKIDGSDLLDFEKYEDGCEDEFEIVRRKQPEISTTTIDATKITAATLTPGDAVEHPNHYTSGKFETIEVIEEITKGYENGYQAYCVGNAIKYLSRAPFKHATPDEDLRKAKKYIEFALGEGE